MSEHAEPGSVPKHPPVNIGTGMPQTILLEAFGDWIYSAFGKHAYQVGSSTKGKVWRDVDVRLMLDDDEFHALFPGYRDANQIDAKWALICAALSELGKRMTGLPIDFQVQAASDANARFTQRDGCHRNPLFLYNHASVEAAEKRRAEEVDAAEE